MNIAFDNTRRLKNRVYYFEYKKVRFKLIQNNPRKWSDILLAIVPSDTDSVKDNIRSIAGEYLSALSWQNNSRISVQFLGCDGIRKDPNLRDAKCLWHVFPLAPYDGNIKGYGIDIIPAIDSEEQRLALTLFREAYSSNKILFSFLFYWQILEIGGNKPENWINKVLTRSTEFHLPTSDIRQLNLGSRKLSTYLHDDCRHAIAHICRIPGKTPYKFDLAADVIRMAVSTRIVEEFAKYFIKKELRLSNKIVLDYRSNSYFPLYIRRK